MYLVMQVSRQVIFDGRVQGVGFRYSAKQVAMGFDITGWVRNLPDGRVEMQVMGQADEVDAYLAAIDDSQLGGFIRNKDVRPAPPLVGARGFEIRR